MYVIDSSGWLEWFVGGDLADLYKPYLENSSEILVPSLCIYEVYKVLKREVGEEKSLVAVGYMKNSQVLPFDEILALLAADISQQYKLAMADSILYASAIANRCELLTSDTDFQGLPGIMFFAK